MTPWTLLISLASSSSSFSVVPVAVPHPPLQPLNCSGMAEMRRDEQEGSEARHLHVVCGSGLL